MIASICSSLGLKIESVVTVAMLLSVSIYMLRVGYRCGGGATSVDLQAKLTVESLSFVWYYVSYGIWIFGVIGYTLRVVGV